MELLRQPVQNMQKKMQGDMKFHNLLKKYQFVSTIALGVVGSLIASVLYSWITGDTLLSWLSSSSYINNFTALIIAILAIVGVVELTRKHFFKKHYTQYISDNFDGLHWRWKWEGSKLILSYPLCPDCLFEMSMEEFPQKGSQSHEPKLLFRCIKCQMEKEIKGSTQVEYFDWIRRHIRQKLDTGKYKKHLSPRSPYN